MVENPNAVFRERPLAEVKCEITRRVGHLNPREGIRAADAEQVQSALTSLERDEWPCLWSKFGAQYEAERDALDQTGSDRTTTRERYELASLNNRVGRYPCVGSPGQEKAYRDSVRVFRKAERYFDTTMKIGRRSLLTSRRNASKTRCSKAATCTTASRKTGCVRR